MAFEEFNTVEDLFKKLDKSEFTFFAQALSAYRSALMENGFTRREAMRLVQTYSQFIYNMGLEEFIAEKNKEIDKEFFADDVDSDDDDD